MRIRFPEHVRNVEHYDLRTVQFYRLRNGLDELRFCNQIFNVRFGKTFRRIQ